MKVIYYGKEILVIVDFQKLIELLCLLFCVDGLILCFVSCPYTTAYAEENLENEHADHHYGILVQVRLPCFCSHNSLIEV